MINKKSVLAIIPARGGSKGVPRKNIQKLGEKPLIAWTIEAADKSQYIDRLILSSEDEEIISIAKEWGCEVPFVRPVELSQDDTPGIEPVLHALNTLSEEYDYIVLLQPTSPFRTHLDIDECIELCVKNGAPSCVSVVETSESPYWMYYKNKDNKITPLIKTDKKAYQRQLLPKVFILNGAVYVSKTEYVKIQKTFVTKDTLAFTMHRDHSLDIDSEYDFLNAKVILKINNS